MTPLEYQRAVAHQEFRAMGVVSLSTLTRIQEAGGDPDAEERSVMENAE